MKRERRKKMVLAICLWILSLIFILPLLLVVVNSLKSAAESDIMRLTLPAVPMWENFKVIFREGKVIRSFLNSIVITGVSVTMSAVLGSMAAFVLARNQSRLNKLVRNYFMLGLIIPVQIISLIEVLRWLHLYNRIGGLILLYVAIFLPMTLMLAYNGVKAIPREMDEAAMIDGCGSLKLFFHVILPLMRPIITTIFVTQFMFVWNDFQFPLYLLSDSNKWTLVLGVYGFIGKYSSQWNLVCAHILVSSLPVVVIYMFGQKYIVDGMVAGAVKG